MKKKNASKSPGNAYLLVYHEDRQFARQKHVARWHQLKQIRLQRIAHQGRPRGAVEDGDCGSHLRDAGIVGQALVVRHALRKERQARQELCALNARRNLRHHGGIGGLLERGAFSGLNGLLSLDMHKIRVYGV